MTSLQSVLGFPGGSDGKVSAYNAGDPCSIPGSGRSSGEGNGNPFQYSWHAQKVPMDRGAWRATVHGVAESDTIEQLSTAYTAYLDQALHSLLPDSQTLTSPFLVHALHKTDSNFFVSLRCEYFPCFLPVLQPRTVFLRDLGAIPMKCNHQGRWSLNFQSLWKRRILTLEGTLLHVIKVYYLLS